MATPRDHLPPALTESSITRLLTSLHLPSPSSITPLQVTAEYHSIYAITWPASLLASELSPPTTTTLDASGDTTSLVLRVSGNHIARAKTRNEVAVMKWIRDHPQLGPRIPVPAVVRWDDGCDNAIGHEFTLLERAAGQSVDKMYPMLREDTKRYLVEQLTDMFVELNTHAWNHVGGLTLSDGDDDESAGENVVPGPLLEDTFWMAPDVTRFWNSEESVQSLNPMKVYNSHADMVRGRLEVFVHSIQVHHTLAWLRDMIPRLEALMDRLPEFEKELGATKLILAHRDCHFANIMAKPDGTITAILDWEFAAVVPALRWDPPRAFLWNGQDSAESMEEKYRLRALFEEGVAKRGVAKWWEEGVSDAVTNIWEVIRFTRALVEVCPRGQKAEATQGWREEVEKALSLLHV